MRFVCDSCRAQYMISDDKIGAKGVKIRCKKCGHVTVVRPAGAAAPKDEGAPAAEATAAAASNGAANSSAAGLPASLGTPPEGGLFTDVEEDEIGAVFDQVLSGAPKMGAEPAKESKPATPDAVRKLAEAEPDEPKAPPANDWYVAIDEKQVGPLTVEKVKEHWDRGEVGPDSLCWRQGFGDWVPLSEVSELASVLAPRPAKPVIVAPAAVSGTMPAVSAPVESAFSAPKPTRPEIPAAPALGMEPTSGWKPSAASVLASLVKEENEALSKPPAKPAVEEKPAAPGLLDLPPPPEPVSAPALQAAPMMAAAEPMRAPQPSPMPYAPVAPAPAYAQPAPAYAQPAPAYAGYAQPAYPGYPPAAAPGAQGGGNKTIMVAGIAAGVVVLLAVGGYFAFGRSSPPPAPPEPVKVAEATPPPAAPTPAPEVKAQPTPAAAANPPAPAAVTPTPAPAPAATASAAGATQPAAVAPAPAPTAPPAPAPAASEPVATRTSSSRERTSSSSHLNRESRSERAERSESRSESVGSSAKSKPDKSDEGSDDFDDLFGPKKSEKKSTAQSGGPSTYIPPEPGSGSNVLERLGTSDIMAVVLANKSAIKRCVDEQKKRDPGISGKLVMHWVIQTSGRTTGVSVKSDEYKRTYMASCIAGLIRGWTFPRHKKQGDPIDFPFTF
jgi:predicted Zn finger-like uncharacterized protein